MKEQSNNIFNFFANNIVWLFGIFFGIPLFIQLGSLVTNGVSTGEYVVSGDWLAFWGGYLGVMPAGIIAWMVADQQIKSDRRNARRMFIEQKYITDLLALRDIISKHRFKGEWFPPYNLYFGDIKEPFILTSEEITVLRKMFLKITVGSDGKEKILTDSLFNMRIIINGLPSSNSETFRQSADLMFDNIELLASYSPLIFEEFENESTQEYKKMDDDFDINTPDTNLLSWQKKSKEFADHMRLITENFKKVNDYIEVELSKYYRLDQ